MKYMIIKYKKLCYPVIAINPNNPEKQKDDSFDKMKVRAKEKLLFC